MFTKKHLQTLINHAVRRLSPMKKLSAVTWRNFENLLITKLLAYVNFVIFHEKVFLVKLSVS